ncbi:RusA family crossover junction endodeoxyribonuclease [Streptococcus parauberis]|uniref:Crossover junction endodeoxyribonuclease RusA n=1 Tax=Streptococcus parauberis NCFD 2020 TaxID=873447 RepID=F1Z0R0_9STRE|nr:RusA family crossover junction endodeoxyribonuclease [Streptococcus parauberis]EGE54177.1 crossover junction endodeoxyribonuclease RusA [Streptococcus parauberis NCFD 2020]QBX18317.1 holliday junction resolvase [Streptococcus phage Javan411]QBX27630.1 holliday junction resolvase [Streptococcus phage Javan400]
MNTYKLIIPIEPKPQSRPRSSIKNNRIIVREDRNMRVWRRACTMLVKNLYKGPFYETPIKVDVTFFMEAPEKLKKEPSERSRQSTKEKFIRFVKELIWHDKLPDIDNLVKSVFDSITKSNKVWSDDNIICYLVAKKVYSPNPRIEVEITEL